MEINVRDDSKLVEIWLTNAEKRNAELRENLKPLYQEYKAKNYLVAVFESGERIWRTPPAIFSAITASGWRRLKRGGSGKAWECKCKLEMSFWH